MFNFLLSTLQRPLKKNKDFAVILAVTAQLQPNFTWFHQERISTCLVPLQNSDCKQADHLHMPAITHNNFTFHLINSFASLHTNT